MPVQASVLTRRVLRKAVVEMLAKFGKNRNINLMEYSCAV